MKPTACHRWLQLIVWVWVMVIIVMLIIPGDLTDEQLAQIQPGMTMEQVKSLLGQPFDGAWSFSSLVEIDPPDGLSYRATHFGHWGKPSYYLRYSGGGMYDDKCIWIGKTRLLSVEHRNGVVTMTWLFPIISAGGGVQGCIDSLRYYWRKSTGTLSTSPS